MFGTLSVKSVLSSISLNVYIALFCTMSCCISHISRLDYHIHLKTTCVTIKLVRSANRLLPPAIIIYMYHNIVQIYFVHTAQLSSFVGS